MTFAGTLATSLLAWMTVSGGGPAVVTDAETQTATVLVEPPINYPVDALPHQLMQAVAVRIRLRGDATAEAISIVRSSDDQAIDRAAAGAALKATYSLPHSDATARDYLQVFRFAPWSGDVDAGPLIDYNEHGVVVVRDGFIAYPEDARRQQSEGTVIVRVLIDVRGAPGPATVQSSSGSPLLDETAIRAVKSGVYLPAFREGKAVESEYKTVYRFDFHRIEST